MIPAARLPNVRRRAERARRFPTNTCAASRHVELIAESFLDARKNRSIAQCDREDAEHCAASLYSVLGALWKLRTEIAKLKGKK